MKPLFSRVLLKREKPGKIGSIHLPAEAQARHAATKCRVMAKGPNAADQIRIGSWVLIGKFAGDWIDSDGKPVPDGEYFICQDEDILCELEDEDERADDRASDRAEPGWAAVG